MDLSGHTLGSFISPVSDYSGYLSPEGFALDPRDGSFWIGLVNSGNVLHLSSTGSYMSEYYVGGSPNDVAVGPDGKTYITQVFSAYLETLDPSSGSTAFFAGTAGFPIDLTWGVDGNLWVGTVYGGAEVFNPSGPMI